MNKRVRLNRVKRIVLLYVVSSYCDQDTCCDEEWKIIYCIGIGIGIAFDIYNTIDEEDDFYLYFVTIVVVSVLLCVIIVIGRVTLYRMQSCSHDNDSPTSQGKDKGSALEMCKPTATKFDALSVHEDAINVKGEGNMTNTIAGLPLSPLMTKEVRTYLTCN